MTTTDYGRPGRARTDPDTSTPERTLVVWCPDWPVVASGLPSTAPVAVVHANRVVACSVAARAEGVRRGLRRREAQARCPELVVVDHDPARDARAFEPVVAAVEAFTPRVEIVRPGTCAFATRGPSRYFGGDEALAIRVAAAVNVAAGVGVAAGEVVGIDCCIGVADGPFAASVAARRGLVVRPAGSAAFLAPLPVTQLERPELTDLLVRLGLRTLGDLAALPAADVLARFGPEGALAHRLAAGLDERPLAARTPPADLAASAELDPPATRVDTAAFVAKVLADELHGRLADLGLACTRVAIEAETEHGEHLVRLWRHDGALTAGAMAERVRWQLNGWLDARTACRCAPVLVEPPCPGDETCPSPGGGTSGALTLLRLVPDEVRPDHGRQLGFWGGEAAAADRASRALARLQGMLGPEAVTTAVLGGGRSPAEQVRLVPWGDAREPARPGIPASSSCSQARHSSSSPSAVGRSAARREPLPPWPGQVPAPAPATVHVPPLAAQVVDADGNPVSVSGRATMDTPPARLSVAGHPSVAVDGWAGPWTVDERWWDPSAHRRRARFQVVTHDGVARLLALEGGRWWVEATYD